MTSTDDFGRARVLTAMVTPMFPGGAVDLESCAALAVRLVDGGTEGIVLASTTGEGATLSDTERELLFLEVLRAVNGRAVVVAGVGTADTAHSVHLAKRAKMCGVDGLLLVAPYYSRPSASGVLAHFRAVADATELPVILYNIPHRTGQVVTYETLSRIAEHPNVFGVKDAYGDMAQLTRLLTNTELFCYAGDDGATLPIVAIGGHGVIGVGTHFAAPVFYELIRAVRSGDLARGRALNERLAPLVQALMNHCPASVAVKAVLAAAGVIPSATVRLPLDPPSTSDMSAINADLALWSTRADDHVPQLTA